MGRATRTVLHEAIAKHFAIKAMELLTPPPEAGAAPHPGEHLNDKDPRVRLEQCALKLTFYVVFTMRSRTALTMISMRSLSMLMMIFMMMAITVTKQHQARRYAELYGYGHHGNPFLSPMVMGGGMYGRGMGGLEARRQMMLDEAFWDDFENGRRGTALVRGGRARGGQCVWGGVWRACWRAVRGGRCAEGVPVAPRRQQPP